MVRTASAFSRISLAQITFCHCLLQKMDLSASVFDITGELTEIQEYLRGMKQAYESHDILQQISRAEFHLLEWYRIALHASISDL